MAAPKKNQFWKLRSKHGREKLFETPELLWEAACEYFKWCDSHPWHKVEQAKMPGKATKDKNGQPVFPPNIIHIPTQRPYTLSGFCIYANASEAFWKNFRKNKSLSEDFLSIIQSIEEIIRTQQFEGAAVGAFNGNIISRSLGMAEQTENRNTNINFNSKELTTEEIKKIGKALEDEF